MRESRIESTHNGRHIRPHWNVLGRCGFGNSETPFFVIYTHTHTRKTKYIELSIKNFAQRYTNQRWEEELRKQSENQLKSKIKVKIKEQRQSHFCRKVNPFKHVDHKNFCEYDANNGGHQFTKYTRSNRQLLTFRPAGSDSKSTYSDDPNIM